MLFRSLHPLSSTNNVENSTSQPNIFRSAAFAACPMPLATAPAYLVSCVCWLFLWLFLSNAALLRSPSSSSSSSLVHRCRSPLRLLCLSRAALVRARAATPVSSSSCPSLRKLHHFGSLVPAPHHPFCAVLAAHARILTRSFACENLLFVDLLRQLLGLR